MTEDKTDQDERPKPESPHRQMHKGRKHSTAFKIIKRIAKLVSPLILIILFWLVVIHFTAFRHRLGRDPIGRGIEIVQQKMASSNADKASAHLTISENRFRDYKDSQKTTAKPGYQNRLIVEMIAQNKLAIGYMDAAKKDGKDIKKLNLVQRLCDLLGAQNRALSASNQELLTQHTFAEKLEDKVEAGQEVDKAIEEVRKDLNAAMHW